jgi:hypothetical protein
MRVSFDRIVTLSIVAIVSLTSIVLMLSWASPELTWDEAAYAENTPDPWWFLWSKYNYDRHWHGPLSIYLAKLGRDIFSTDTGSTEWRLRFFEALAGSLAVGLLYWLLRYSFRTSRAAAIVGSGLLLFSVIRLGETPIIGPHHLILACTLGIIALGYKWYDRPGLQAAFSLGTLMGFGAVSMTYVIPVALCWAVAVSLAGSEWVAWDKTHFKVSWAVPILFGTAAIVVMVLWPPGLLNLIILKDFRFYLHYPIEPILVGDRVFQIPPRWAVIYWFAHLDAPILVFSASIILAALWKAFRMRRLTSKHLYLTVCLAFFLATLLTAHLAGARNLLLFLGVLCIATGALFDEALDWQRATTRLSWVVVIIITAMLNLAWAWPPRSWMVNGYRAFVTEEENRLHEPVKVLASAPPILKFYAREHGIPLAWDVLDVWSTTRISFPVGQVKYVLVGDVFYNHLPTEHSLHRIVDEHWKAVWSYNENNGWKLRLYENPNATEP